MLRFYSLPILIFITSCMALSPQSSDHGINKVAPPKNSPNIKQSTLTETTDSKLLLRVVQLEHDVKTLKAQIDVLNRAVRSGLMDISLPENSNSQTHNTLPPLDSERSSLDSSFLIDDVYLSEAHKTLEKIKERMKYGHYGESIVNLNKFKKDFPRYKDDGEVLVLTAESSNKVKQYSNALLVLKDFYFAHPTSSFKLRAKLLEAEALRFMNAKAKAIEVLNEVISIGSGTKEADMARAELEKLRGNI